MNPVLAYRYATGRSREEVAEDIGVHLETVRRWEDGDTLPEERHLFAMAKIIRGTKKLPAAISAYGDAALLRQALVSGYKGAR